MEIAVVKELTFDAAHYLPEYDGKCGNIHGHTFKLQVGVRGKVNEDTGMVLDFSWLKGILEREIIDKLDHGYLNDLSDVTLFPEHMPTAEFMVAWTVRVLEAYLQEYEEGLVELYLVRLYESPTSYAEWREGM